MAKQIKNNNDPLWFDDITGIHVNKETLKTVADIVGGRLEGDLVAVKGAHGELVIRIGDYVGVDQKGVWHIIRLSLPDDINVIRQKASNLVTYPTFRKKSNNNRSRAIK